ncbi:MAG TPA: glycogen synthase GlgA [Aurantimonas coralicida]|uniref:Glycogen synthase n=2 Tax=root TaxID=1 RepID=A0A9C9THS5_9HYPH|nr:glycogen synthase GlgA [Aurantimonas coralicida]HEU01637.1 glycogen synthase GlgA [Aurantimonas coralicida]
MRVLFVTSECHPLIKTGGLADISAALPVALAESGVDIRLMMPGYQQALDRADHVGHAIPLGELPGGGQARLLPTRCPDSGMPLWLVDCPTLYRRNGGPYQGSDGRDWPDNDLRFAALCHAAARVARNAAGLTWQPDLIHTNDWHTGPVSLLLDGTARSRPPVVFTIHNLAFQGLFDANRGLHLGLPADTFSPEGIEFHDRISFLKAGLRYADRLTTVSRTYAKEIQTPEFGCGLDGLLRQRSQHLLGISNGADYGLWDPAEDSCLPRRYSLAEIGGKRVCKEVLQRELGLDVEPETPVLAFLSRLTEQKMADTVAEAMPWLVAAGAQVALHGQGDRALEERFRALAEQYPGRVSVRVGYEERSARRLLAGGDILLHPSRFEPFGLVPIYALRYGTLPVVRGVGGLADSVVDGTTAGLDGEATGFAFCADTLEDLIACLRRALGVFRQPMAWRRMQRHAMRQDFGWQQPAQEYLKLYRTLTGSRAELDRRQSPWSDEIHMQSPEPKRAHIGKG